MERSFLLFQDSPWLILLGILAGIVYAWLLYSKEKFTPGTRRAMAILRGLVVFFLVLLLAGPLLNQTRTYEEQPAVALLIDDSSSIPEAEVLTNELIEKLSGLKNRLNEAGYETTFWGLEGMIPGDSLPGFDRNQTNLDKGLKEIRNAYEGGNLTAVVLISDGLHNTGLNPLYSTYGVQIHTVGIGDTTERADTRVVNLNYNKVVAQGNRFPVVVEIAHEGFSGQSAQLSIIHNGRVLDQKPVQFSGTSGLLEVEFLPEATNMGLQRYEVVLSPQEGEFNTVNNKSFAYVEVVEGAQKVLIVASAPHPDIKAMRSAIELGTRFELDLYIPGIHPEPSEQKYDLVILYQIPDLNGTTQSLFTKYTQTEGQAILFILGNNTRLSTFNLQEHLVQVESRGGDRDRVTPRFNRGFTPFQLPDERTEIYRQYPPIEVPFGKYNLAAGVETMLWQQVGAVETQKPILVVRTDPGEKRAVWIGEGFWRWRLFEFSRKGNAETFDETFTKLFRYLATREDRRKFRFYPLKNEFTDQEPVIFESEEYNELYERIYGNTISLEIKSQEGSVRTFTFESNEYNTRYRTGVLPDGIYEYVAKTTIAGNRETITGEFMVNASNIELQDLSADHQLLRALAEKNSGIYVPSGQLVTLESLLLEQKPPKRLHYEEAYLPAINLKWIFFLILTLISLEWFSRKYHGSY